jgi:NAD+ kinase
MSYKFKNIGLIGRKNTAEIVHTLNVVCNFLKDNNISAFIDAETATLLDNPPFPILSRTEIGEQCELAIVVGGDGSILRAARTLSSYKISVIGIHRGRLGFLTDIAPNNVEQQLQSVLLGHYVKTELFLLHADIINNNKVKKTLDAVNEVVLNSGNITKMVEFEVYINDQFVLQQRADGIIIATPTGSTAYSLSGGGPILTPNLKALTMVPMFPHNLTSRPIVIPDNSKIKLVPILNSKICPNVSCDGQPVEHLDKDDIIEIYKSDKILHLIHPSNYNYYETLRTKLHWGTKPI